MPTRDATGASKGATTRQRIVDRAIALASSDGVAGLTLGRLADDVGMSKSGLFAHFRSKEELQVQVLEETIERFRETVVLPALQAPRGEPRVRALFERWMAWADDARMPGGCLIQQASIELDDRPGAPRDLVAGAQRQWLDTIAEAARRAVREGHFRRDLDPDLFALQLFGAGLAYHQAGRLFRDAATAQLARQAFDALVEWARA